MGDADGPPPDPLIINDEAGDKIFVLTGWNPIFNNGTNDFIAGALGSIS